MPEFEAAYELGARFAPLGKILRDVVDAPHALDGDDSHTRVASGCENLINLAVRQLVGIEKLVERNHHAFVSGRHGKGDFLRRIMGDDCKLRIASIAWNGGWLHVGFASHRLETCRSV